MSFMVVVQVVQVLMFTPACRHRLYRMRVGMLRKFLFSSSDSGRVSGGRLELEEKRERWGGMVYQ